MCPCHPWAQLKTRRWTQQMDEKLDDWIAKRKIAPTFIIDVSKLGGLTCGGEFERKKIGGGGVEEGNREQPVKLGNSELKGCVIA